jgi:glycogen debranching enzyme
VRLDASGVFEVVLRPLTKGASGVMNFESIVLRSPSGGTAAVIAPPVTRFGEYFAKKLYAPEPLPSFDTLKDRLPEPIIAGHADWLPMYWKCWQLAFAHLKKPQPGSPLVSNWLDEWFSPNIFQWDTCFMMMFARYGHAEFPFIRSLDNFYCRQRTNGYMCREYVEADGREIKFGAHGGFDDPHGWANSVNPPLFAWAECESFKVTGDTSRFAAILPVLEKYVEFLNRDGDPDAPPDAWLEQGRRSVGTPHRLYWNTDLGSGMDDIPKPTKKGAGWVDMSCQMVMQYRELALICRQLGVPEKAARYEAEATAIGERINHWCWNETDGFYYDVLADGTQFRKKTACGFWPMLAGIAAPAQVRRMVAHLKDPGEFWRPFVFPALSADEKEYNNPSGSYWRGAVWAPTNYTIIKGLEACGEEAFATEATEKYLGAMNEVFQKRGTVFENYMPERIEPSSGKGDFVGWTAVGPITLLIENVLGFRPDGAHDRLDWRLVRPDRHGIRRLRFGQVTTDVLYDGDGTVSVTADRPYTLVINGHAHAVPAGASSFTSRP